MNLYYTSKEDFIDFFGLDMYEAVENMEFNFRFGSLSDAPSFDEGHAVAAVTPGCPLSMSTGRETIVLDKDALQYCVNKFFKGDLKKHRQIARGSLMHELTHVKQMTVGDLTEPPDPYTYIALWKGVPYKHPKNQYQYLSQPWERDAHIVGYMVEHEISEESATKIFDDVLWRAAPFWKKVFLKLKTIFN